jgi:Domain of unknown function DUF29
MNTTPQYNKDFYAWAIHSAKLLRQGKFKEIDVKHIAEEIESMGGRDRNALINRLAILMAHLLKWQFQSGKRTRSWRLTIKEQRMRVIRLIDGSPSLNHEIALKLEDAYQQAVVRAARETGMAEKNFPKKCPYSLEQCLRQGFLPAGEEE